MNGDLQTRLLVAVVGSFKADVRNLCSGAEENYRTACAPVGIGFGVPPEKKKAYRLPILIKGNIKQKKKQTPWPLVRERTICRQYLANKSISFL
jgi:hypothetical protein